MKTSNFVALKCLCLLSVASLSGPVLAQTPTPLAQDADILGLRPGMTPVEVVNALQAAGNGRITYHFAEPRFRDGKCDLDVDSRYSNRAGASTTGKMPTPDSTTRTYMLRAIGDTGGKPVTCGTFLTDITYLDLTERDGGRALATKLLAPGDADPKLSSDCDSIEVYKPFNNKEAMEASGRLISHWITEALPAQIIACEAIRVIMTPMPGEERSALVSRIKVYRSVHPSFDAIQKGLQSKYGAVPTGAEDESRASSRDLRQRWTFGPDGRLLAPQQLGGPCRSSLGISYNEMTPPITTSIASNCGVSVHSRIASLKENPYLVGSLSVVMLNQAVLYRLLKDRAALATRINDDAARAQAGGAAPKTEKF